LSGVTIHFACATPRSGSALLRFVAEHTATLGGVLAHLGLEVERIPDPPMDRQGDAHSESRVARLNDEKELV
jgi:LPS sulfotransferase NodH